MNGLTNNRMSQRVRWLLALVGIVVAAGWPFPIVRLLKRNHVPLQPVILLWAVLMMGAFAFLWTTHRRSLSLQGRSEVRPNARGIAGKPRGLIIHRSVILVCALPLFVAVISYPSLLKPWTVVGLLIVGKLLFDYASTVLSERRQLVRIVNRVVAADGHSDHQSIDGAAEAMRVIARTFDVPIGKISQTDRFGTDIGLLSYLDPRLDILGGALLLRARQRNEQVDLTRISTVRDYVRVWNSIS